MRAITTWRKFFRGKERTRAFEFGFGDDEADMEN
jgi:hypothetical protein